MKKYLLSLFTVLLVVASCTKFEEEKADPVIAGGETTISLVAPVGGVASDSAFVATITPAAATSFYSYVITDTEIKEPVAATLFKVGYKGLAQGTVNAKTDEVFKISMKKLTPNTTYYVYAVSANGQGTIGAVASASIKTTDNLTPTPDTEKVKHDAAKLTSVFTFNEPIKRGDAAKKAYATYFKVNNPDDSLIVTIPEDRITIKGNTLSFKAPIELPGAYVFITYEAGLVQNAIGTPDKGYMTLKFDEKDPLKKSLGVGYRIEPKPFDFNIIVKGERTGKDTIMPADTQIYFLDETTLSLYVAADSAIHKIDKEYDVIATYKGETVTTAYKLDAEVDYPVGVDTALVVNLGRFYCDYGMLIDLFIGEGSYEDDWGNPNKEYATEDNFMKSYGLTRGDVVGTYSFAGVSYVLGPYTETGIVIDEITDDPDSVAIYKFCLACPRYATYFGSDAVISVEDSIPAVIDGITGYLYAPELTPKIASTSITNTSGVVINFSIYLEFAYTGYDIEMLFRQPGRLDAAYEIYLKVVREDTQRAAYIDYFTGVFTKTGAVPVAPAYVPYARGNEPIRLTNPKNITIDTSVLEIE